MGWCTAGESDLVKCPEACGYTNYCCCMLASSIEIRLKACLFVSSTLYVSRMRFESSSRDILEHWYSALVIFLYR